MNRFTTLMALDDNQRADYYSKLAKSAWDRFASRRDIEWKTCIAIWSLFAAGAFGVFASSATLPWYAFALAVVGACLVLVSYYFWLRYITEAMRRDQLTCYYWESGVQNILGKRVPPLLEPSASPPIAAPGEWQRVPPGEEPHPAPGGDGAVAIKSLTRFHRSQICQLVIAGGFAVLFLAAVSLKAFGLSPSALPKLSVEGQFEVDSVSKVKLSH